MNHEDLIIDGYPTLTARYPDGRNYGNNSHLLKRLLMDHKECFWCKIVVYYNLHKDGVSPPPASATIDHLVSRFVRKNGEISPKVIACDRCNHRRAKAEGKKYGKSL